MLPYRTSKSLHRGVVVSLPACSCSSLSSGNHRRSFSNIATRRQEHKTQYYAATLPWSNKDEDRKERFNSLIKNARLSENDSIVASSITTSKRASPIASSLKAEIDHLESTAKKGGGAWLLLQADDESQAKDLLKHLKVDQVFDLEKATLQAIHLQQEAEAGGPLYDVSSDSNSNSNLNKSENVANEDRSQEGDAPETVFGDKTTGGDAEAGKEKSKDESTGGHSVETAGPLYGK